MHRILLIAILTQALALPAMAQSASSAAGNVDPRAPGAGGSTGVNDIAVVMGDPASVATARSGYGYPYDSSVQALQGYFRFNPSDYASVSDCLTASYAAGAPLAQCER